MSRTSEIQQKAIPFEAHESPKAKSKCTAPSKAICAIFQALKELPYRAFHSLDLARKKVFYHVSLSYNLIRHTVSPKNWEWWSNINDHIILGAVPLKNKGHLEAVANLGVTLIYSLLEDFEYENGLLTEPVQESDWKNKKIRVGHFQSPDGQPVDENRLREVVHEILTEINHGGKVYIHCKAGRGRSCLTTTAALMTLKPRKSFDEVYQFIKEKRPQVFLRTAQQEQMKNYQPGA